MNHDQMPCYLATCPTCHGSVMICVADPSNLAMMTSALKERRACERAGLTVETLTVAEGKARLQERFGHADDCAKDPRRRKRTKQQPLYPAASLEDQPR